MAKIIWLKNAAHDLVTLRNSIAGENTQLAKYTAEAITMGATVLLNNFHLGKPVEYLPNYYDWVIPFGATSCILRYRMHNNHIYIVQVLHGQGTT
jgi:plasmid stabilization system protein ParE